MYDPTFLSFLTPGLVCLQSWCECIHSELLPGDAGSENRPIPAAAPDHPETHRPRAPCLPPTGARRSHCGPDQLQDQWVQTLPWSRWEHASKLENYVYWPKVCQSVGNISRALWNLFYFFPNSILLLFFSGIIFMDYITILDLLDSVFVVKFNCINQSMSN